ncbi:MAG: dtdp-4-dehydrorhamnose reductase, partial [candidate division NC10 bacterium]|nr:dtdp-4-dehydrorhamnose reductase [candidate division NC10 bacterium]
NDKLGTPTYTYDFAQNVLVLLQTGFWGLYNMACAGATSRLDVAREVVAILGMEETIRIVEVSSEHFQNEYFAQRPPSERLTNAKLRLRGLDAMRPWQIALREYLEKEFSR